MNRDRWTIAILAGILVIVVLLQIGAVAVLKFNPFARSTPAPTPFVLSTPARTPRPTSTSIVNPGPVIVEIIHREAKLQTTRMTLVNDHDITRVSGLGGICTERIVYLGYYDVSAGIDLSLISDDDVTTVNRNGQMTVTLTLPAAEITSVALDTQRSRLLVQETPKWVPGCETQVADMTIEAQQRIRDYVTAAALESGILNQAQEQAGFELQRLLYQFGYPNIEIRYASPEVQP